MPISITEDTVIKVITVGYETKQPGGTYLYCPVEKMKKESYVLSTKQKTKKLLLILLLLALILALMGCSGVKGGSGDAE